MCWFKPRDLTVGRKEEGDAAVSTTRTPVRRSHKHHLPRGGKSDDYGDDNGRGADDGKYEYSSRRQDRARLGGRKEGANPDPRTTSPGHLSKSGALQRALSLSLRLRGS